MSGEENSKWTVIDGSPAFVNKNTSKHFDTAKLNFGQQMITGHWYLLKDQVHKLNTPPDINGKFFTAEEYFALIVDQSAGYCQLSYWTKGEVCQRLDCMQQIKLSILAAKSCWEFGEYFQWQNVKQ